MIYILQKTTPHTEYDIKYSVLRNDKISTNELVDFLDFTITNNFSEKTFFKLHPNTVKGKPFTFNNNISQMCLKK